MSRSMDSEREKFRTYVEKSGVMSALTDVLVHLYEEPQRPPDALSYIKASLGAHTADQAILRCSVLDEKVKEQAATIERLNARVKELEAELSSVRETSGGNKEYPSNPSQPPQANTATPTATPEKAGQSS